MSAFAPKAEVVRHDRPLAFGLRIVGQGAYGGEWASVGQELHRMSFEPRLRE